MLDYFTIQNKMSQARKDVEYARLRDEARYNCRIRRKDLFDKGILEVKKVSKNNFELYCNGNWVWEWYSYKDKYTVETTIAAICNTVRSMQHVR